MIPVVPAQVLILRWTLTQLKVLGGILLALWKAWSSSHRPSKADPGQRNPWVSPNRQTLNLLPMRWPGTQMEKLRPRGEFLLGTLLILMG